MPTQRDALLRILDANANRAREALRVLEDIARFALDRADLAAACKALRHDLREALAPIDPASLLASRDTPSDVGTSISAPGEYARPGIAGIARANASRLAESLRSLEETLKALDLPDVSRTIEQSRYRAYELERLLLFALSPIAPQPRLCVLLTESLCTYHPWQRVAELAVEGGADALQLREKKLSDAELLVRARWLVDLARSHARPRGGSRPHIVINDRPDIALLAGADAVHLGQTDLPVREARELIAWKLAIGVSTSNLDQARRALRDGADSFGLGPMFPSTTKPKDFLAGPAYLREYLADPLLRDRPHLAISGITAANARDLAVLGCRGIAISSAVCSSPDPRSAAAELARIFTPQIRDRQGADCSHPSPPTSLPEQSAAHARGSVESPAPGSYPPP